jgi:hypothetical protein
VEFGGFCGIGGQSATPLHVVPRQLATSLAMLHIASLLK